MVSTIRAVGKNLFGTSAPFPAETKIKAIDLAKVTAFCVVGLYVGYRIYKYLNPERPTSKSKSKTPSGSKVGQKSTSPAATPNTIFNSPTQTCTEWLTTQVEQEIRKIRKESEYKSPEEVNSMVDPDRLSFAFLYTTCRERTIWDLPTLFEGRTRVSSIEDIAQVPTSDLNALSGPDFFSVVDLISGEKSMEIVKDEHVCCHRKMALYFFNTHFTRTFADMQRTASAAAIDEKTIKLAEEFFQKAKKYSQDEMATLQSADKVTALDRIRMQPSHSLRNDLQLKAWQTQNQQYLPAGVTQPTTRLFLEQINSQLRCARPNKDHLGFRRSRDEVSNPDKNIFYMPGREVAQEMTHFTDWLNQEIDKCDKSESNPIITAGLAYQKFVSIHPFVDGNGRTGRLLADLVLRRYRLLPAAWNKEDVNVSIQLTRKEQVTPTETTQRMLSALKNSYQLLGAEVQTSTGQP